MAPIERNAPPSLEEREISDAIGRLENSAGIAGCPGHGALASAQILSLRIGEMLIYRMGVLGRKLDTIERTLAHRITERAPAPVRFGPVEIRVTSAAAVALAGLATYWKARGWL